MNPTNLARIGVRRLSSKTKQVSGHNSMFGVGMIASIMIGLGAGGYMVQNGMFDKIFRSTQPGIIHSYGDPPTIQEIEGTDVPQSC